MLCCLSGACLYEVHAVRSNYLYNYVHLTNAIKKYYVKYDKQQPNMEAYDLIYT